MKCFRVARWRYLWHLRNPTCWAVLGSKWKALLLSQLQHWWQISLRVTQLLELGPEAPQAEQSACITGLISYGSCDAGRTATPNDTSTFYTQFHFVSVLKISGIFPDPQRPLTQQGVKAEACQMLVQPAQNLLVSTTWKPWRSHLAGRLNVSFEEAKNSIHKSTWGSSIEMAEGTELNPGNITVAEKKHCEWFLSTLAQWGPRREEQNSSTNTVLKPLRCMWDTDPHLFCFPELSFHY